MRVLIIILSFIYVGFAIENLGTYGKVYEIAEEDILKWIKKNAKLPNLSKTEIEEKLRKNAKIDINLSVAKEDKTRKEKIIYTVHKDIVVNGTVLAKAGTKINVLEKIRLSRTYIVLADYMLPDFVEYGKNGNTVFLITKGNIYELDKKYPDLFIYGALPQVIRALRVRKIPSIVYQEDDKLVIYEKGYPDGKVKTNTADTSN